MEPPRPQNADTYTEAERAVLKKHVTDIDANIYCIKNLPEEVVAVIFAYVSRSPLSFRRNLLKLLQEGDLLVSDVVDLYGEEYAGQKQAREKAQQFHDKWVVGYGHSSVAEHADLKFALEDVSILATKAIEDNRLGRYTEKSTRYVKFDKQHYHKPAKLMADPELGRLYVETCDFLFDVYDDLHPRMCAFIRQASPKPAEMKERPYEASVSAKACDLVRYILPASTYTMVGCSMNARAAEHALSKLLSSPLEEVQHIGEKMLVEGKKICPTLLKHAASNMYYQETPEDMRAITEKLLDHPEPFPVKPVVLVGYDEDAEHKLIAAMLYEQSELPYEQVLQQARSLTEEEMRSVVRAYIAKRGKFDWPGRALEHIRFTTDILMDYGAFRDVQRHRMNTQTYQRLTTKHGYDIPEEIVDAGFEKEFRAAMEKAAHAFERIAAKYPSEAQYVVPLAYRKRTLFTWNLRNLEHFIRLRSGPQGHTSYRRIAQQLYDEIAAQSPLLASLLTVDKDEYYLGRLKSELATESKLEALKAKRRM